MRGATTPMPYPSWRCCKKCEHSSRGRTRRRWRASASAKRLFAAHCFRWTNSPKKIGFQYAKFEQASRQWDAENLAATLPSESLRKNLQETIRLLLPEADEQERNAGKSRLVVFVDDLDRCEPEAAYRLLEGLKVYLTLDNCVFVLGLNQKAVEGAIANRLAGGLTDGDARKDAQARAASYLEKICQNVWHLPIPDAPGQLVCELVADGGDVPPHQIVWLRKVVAQHQCLPPNPRKLKGLANLVVRLFARLPSDIEERIDKERREEVRALLVVAYVHQFHHDLYVRWQANPSLYDTIGEWCRRGVVETALKDLLQDLKLPVAASDGPQDVEGERVSDQIRFPDPTDASVFWIRDIVRGLSAQAVPALFAPYLQAKLP